MSALNFLCSICIPTYNRSAELSRLLESLAGEDSFRKGLVEVVISDNTSTDQTGNVASSFQKRFPDRVIYFRHPEPVDSHFNFENSMRHGNGTYLKLHNDKSSFLPGGLDKIIKSIQENNSESELFLFLPAEKGLPPQMSVKNTEELVSALSPGTLAAIGSLCIRRDVFLKMEEPFREWRTYFPQIDILFRVLNAGGSGIIVSGIPYLNAVLFYPPQRNQAYIFGTCFLEVLFKEVKNGHLSEKTYAVKKRDNLFTCIIPVHFDFFHQYYAEHKVLPYFPYMKYYRREWYYIPSLLWIAFYWFTSEFIPLHQMLGKIKRHIQKFRDR